MVLKIDYDTVKLQSHLKYVIKTTHKKFPFSSPSLSKIMFAYLSTRKRARHRKYQQKLAICSNLQISNNCV